MGMMTLLTSTAMFAAVRQSVTRHSFVTMLDIWIASVMFFLFSILLEFVIANVMCQRGKKTQALQLDARMRIAYGAAFVIFNIVYWPNVLTSYHSDPCNLLNPHKLI